jgi:MarR family transcriptional regulator, 2-MHQ and catechol-resistance regulon repressor
MTEKRAWEPRLPRKRRKPGKEKQRKAWGAYLELTQAARWAEERVRTPLRVFGVTREEFRLLALLYHHGPLKLIDAEEKLGRGRESLRGTVRRAEEFGWIRLGMTRLASRARPRRAPNEIPQKSRQGREVGTVELTPQGERLIENLLPKQESIVRSVLAQLDSRELDTLTRICRKIQQDENFVKVRSAAALIRAHKEFEAETLFER